MSAQPQKRTWVEELDVAGEQLLESIKQLVHEGNVRHIRIKHEGREVLEIPVTLAVAGGLLAPVVAALGAFAAAVTHCTVEVVREEAEPEAGPAGIQPLRPDPSSRS